VLLLARLYHLLVNFAEMIPIVAMFIQLLQTMLTEDTFKLIHRAIAKITIIMKERLCIIYQWCSLYFV
jgi:hypothetical protein